MKLFAILLAVAIAGNVEASTGKLPKDVKKFLDRRETCDHFRGEIDANMTEREIRRLNHELKRWCSGSDRELQRLKKKYAGQRQVQEAFADLEEGIDFVE